MGKKITAIQPQKRNPNRVNVHLDGEFAFGLARITAAWLKVGQELEQSRIDKLLAEDAGEVAYQLALRYLSYRPRSVKEITDHLRKHETPEAVIAEIVERLAETGMVDDVKFTRMWIENRADFRPRGAYALRAELRQKGIGDAVIETALGDLDETALALQAGRKKAAQLKTAEEQVFKQKMYGFLSRRGFGYETISEVVGALWTERRNTGGDRQHG
jgi:regulatory protein